MTYQTICPVCNNDTLELGEMIDVGFGASNGVKGGPDRCGVCGYIERGPDPTTPSIYYFSKCWELQVDPHPPQISFYKRSMTTTEAEWVKQNVKGNGYGECLKISYAMHLEFPHLRLVRGEYVCPVWGVRDHFFLIDSENCIVDPTARQFPSQGGFYYGHVIPSEDLKHYTGTFK